MKNYHMFLPNYTIGVGCYKEIPYITRRYGKKAVVIGGKTAMEKTKALLLDGIAGSDITITDFIWYGDDATFENADILAEMDVVKEADMIFAVGGGRVVDTCKVVKEKLDKPMFTFPTLGSNCAASTSIAVIYKPDGTLNRYFYSVTPPEHVFIESKVIAESPADLFWAGIGDCISKELEVELAIRNDDVAHTPMVGKQMSKLCIDPILRYGKKAYEDCKNNTVSFEIDQIALDILISTGFASNFTTTEDDYYYNSSLAHAFYNGSTVIPNCAHKHLHGEIVSFGNLVLLTYDKQYEKLEELMKFQKSLELPLTLEEIGLTYEDLDALTEKASSVREWTCAPYEVTKEKFIAAIKECDEIGKKFK